MCQLQKLSSKYNELILLGNSIKKDGVVLLKKRTRLVETSVEDSAGLCTWCLLLSLILSLFSMPVPSDRNITGKMKNKCLSKSHKNVELYDYKIIFALYITIVTCVLAPAAAS